MASLTLLDLICGARGLSLGFKWAGFEPVLAVDTNEAALQTYSAENRADDAHKK
jgi:site-specific DNA-cytosine methylase